MTTKRTSPTISYENVSLLKGDFPAHSQISNNKASIKLVPLVQGFDFSFSNQTEDVLTLSEKFYSKRLSEKSEWKT